MSQSPHEVLAESPLYGDYIGSPSGLLGDSLEAPWGLLRDSPAMCGSV